MRFLHRDFRASAVPEWLAIVTLVTMLVNLALIFLWAPTERTMGNIQQIFYFHVPSAALADVAFVVGGVTAFAYLKSRHARFDALSVSANETGLIFTLVNIVMGCIWARPVWGIWWTWDARLTSQFLMLLIYIGYLIARRAIDEPNQRAVICAVLSLFGLVDMPLVYLSNRIFRTQHPAPVLFGGKDAGLDPRMMFVFFFSMFAFALLLICLIRARERIERLQRTAHALRMHVLEIEDLKSA